jgi:hypothetical protein
MYGKSQKVCTCPRSQEHTFPLGEMERLKLIINVTWAFLELMCSEKRENVSYVMLSLKWFV